MRDLSLVDMSCSGATTLHVRDGGQAFLGPQLGGLAKNTKWVTLTAGGNDVSYVGDLSFLAGGKDQTFMGWALRQFWSGPKRSEQRDFAKLRTVLASTLAQIKQRAPQATIIVVTYPTILPETGTCANLGLSSAEADEMRNVGNSLAALTSAIAQDAGALVVDMHKLGAGHDACWINRVAPTVMIMCPCVDGLSHNEAENISPEWAAAGTDVLLHAVLDVAEVVS